MRIAGRVYFLFNRARAGVGRNSLHTKAKEGAVPSLGLLVGVIGV